MPNRPLRVFLCHSSNDKPAVRELYQKLRAESSWIEPWLDEEDLLGGQDYDLEIAKATRNADVIIICLSKASVKKTGYVNKEIRHALEISQEKPEGVIYIIPLRLDNCIPSFEQLKKLHWVDYFLKDSHEKLIKSLRVRAISLGLRNKLQTSRASKNIKTDKKKTNSVTPKKNSRKIGNINVVIHGDVIGSNLIAGDNNKSEMIQEKPTVREKSESEKFLDDFHKQYAKPPEEYKNEKIILSNDMEFMRVPAGRFIMGSDNSIDDEKPQHTVEIPYDYWMARFSVTNELYTAYLKSIGIKPFGWEKKKDHPIVRVSWNDIIRYCKWLNDLLKNELPNNLILRLPTEAEWEKAARGTDGREYPWGNEFDKNKCNTDEGGKEDTTPVGLYSPKGDSPYGCADMIGNVWEWTSSLYNPYPFNIRNLVKQEPKNDILVIRGGSWDYFADDARGSSRNNAHSYEVRHNLGFRMVLAPSSFLFG